MTKESRGRVFYQSTSPDPSPRFSRIVILILILKDEGREMFVLLGSCVSWTWDTVRQKRLQGK